MYRFSVRGTDVLGSDGSLIQVVSAPGVRGLEEGYYFQTPLVELQGTQFHGQWCFGFLLKQGFPKPARCLEKPFRAEYRPGSQ